jgi:hypothetical protein
MNKLFSFYLSRNEGQLLCSVAACITADGACTDDREKTVPHWPPLSPGEELAQSVRGGEALAYSAGVEAREGRAAGKNNILPSHDNGVEPPLSPSEELARTTRGGGALPCGAGVEGGEGGATSKVTFLPSDSGDGGSGILCSSMSADNGVRSVVWLDFGFYGVCTGVQAPK